MQIQTPQPQNIQISDDDAAKWLNNMTTTAFAE